MFFSRLVDHFKKIDWILVLIPVFLSIFGIVVQYSISSGSGSDVFVFNNFIKQIMFFSVSIIVMFVISFYEFQALFSRSNYLYIFVLFLLFLVLVVGAVTRGARSWFDFGFFKFQPVELLKIVSVLVLSFFWVNNNRKNVGFRDIFNSIFLMSPAFLLILMQPDFGSFILVFLTTLFFVFISNTNIKHYLFFIISFIVLALSFWFFIFKDYQKDRILSFLNPISDPLGAGYQVTQSIIAIGSGGFYGKGFGFGGQSQLNFLPEKGNDFVFASFSEEFGFIGVVIILGAYGLFFYRGYSLTKTFTDDASVFIYTGYLFLFFVHIVINIGMNLGVAPVTGISLPFISYGGSGLLSSFVVIGVMQNVAISQKKF